MLLIARIDDCRKPASEVLDVWRFVWLQDSDI